MANHSTLEDAVTRGKGRERSFKCPIHDDSHASASVNVLKQKWVCYACGAHGNLDEVVEADDSRFGRDISELLNTDVRVYSEEWLFGFKYPNGVHPYWLSRFNAETAKHFDLGFDWTMGAPCYPMRSPSGEVWGVVLRNLGTEGPKYLYPYGPKKSQTLFNYSPEHTETVILCEGAMDVAAAWEAGHEAFGIYGAQVSKTQYRLINKVLPDRIVLCFDNDKAGWAATEVAGNKFCDLGYEVVVPDWQDGVKDIAELDVQSRRTLLDSLAI